MNTRFSSTRFHVERLYSTALDKTEVWIKETIAGERTITRARKERAALRKELGMWQKFRIVKVRVTTTREVVK